jgi:hypothetical protein
MSYTISQLTAKGGPLGPTDILEVEVPVGGGVYVTRSITGQEIKDFTGSLGGENYIFVNSDDTPENNGIAFYNAYETAKTLTPNGAAISSTNQVTIVLATGIYSNSNLPFGANYVTMDTEWINVTSLTGEPDVAIDSSPFSPDILNVSANNVKITGITSLNGVDSLICEDAGNMAGCVFTNCIVGPNSFGSYGFNASGTYVNCTAGDASFGGSGGSALGYFINCVGNQYCFGSEGFASGYFKECYGQFGSFGGLGEASGTFVNCSGSTQCFGDTFSGIAYNCQSGDESFGKTVNNGICYSCIANGGSYQMNDGILYYCRLITGTFASSITGIGKIVLGIDGNNNIQNLG